jgi:hypothetical protein
VVLHLVPFKTSRVKWSIETAIMFSEKGHGNSFCNIQLHHSLLPKTKNSEITATVDRGDHVRERKHQQLKSQ